MTLAHIQVRRDTAANWTSANPVLAAGEIGFETNTGKSKIGDGSTAWTSLAYIIDSASETLAGKVELATSAETSTGTDNTRALHCAGAAAVYAKLASPTFTGTPAAPTAGAGTNTTQIATTAFVGTALAGTFAADGDIGLTISGSAATASPWTPTVNDVAIAKWTGTANITVNAPGAIAGTGEIKKTLELANTSGSAIAVTFSGFGGYDGVQPPTSIAATTGVNRYVIRTVNSGTTWFIGGDPNYSDWPTKATPVAADTVLMSDSADSGKIKVAALYPDRTYVIPLSDLATAITASTSVKKNYMALPFAYSVIGVPVVYLDTVQASGNIFTVDIKEGATSILSTLITVDNTEANSTTAVTAGVVSDAAIAAHAQLNFFVTQIGNSSAKGCSVAVTIRKS